MKYFLSAPAVAVLSPCRAQSLYEKYERFLTTPRTYVCYRADGKLKMDGKLNESSLAEGGSYRSFCRHQRRGIPRSQI